MKKNTILITGASGFVGSCLAHHFLKLQDKNTKLVLLSHHELAGYDESRGEVVSVRGSINDYNLMCNIISKHEITTIYHLAANSIVRKCANDPVSAYTTNVMGTVTLLEAVRNVGMNTVKKVIIFTSDKVYGHAPHPYTEETFFMPKYTYEASKACQDIVAQNYFYNYGVPVNIVRCSNIYGPNDPNTSRLIPNVISCINRKENPKLNSGVKDYVREFVYIDDVIDAMTLIASEAMAGEIFCVGGTENVSILELINKICMLMGHDKGVDIIDKPGNFQEVREQSIDATKLKSFGWTPKVSLEEGLKICILSPDYL